LLRILCILLLCFLRFVEPIQGEGGVVPGSQDFMSALRKRSDETGTLLIFDEALVAPVVSSRWKKLEETDA
jgi:glutamate-1-semialdehyde aminotransferase